MPPLQSRCSSVLCLDFDGVLHRASDAIHLPPSSSNGPLLLVQLKAQKRLVWLDLLTDLLEDRQDVAVLVHSTWRRRFDQSTLAHLLGPLHDRVLQPPGFAVDLLAPAPAFIRQSLDWMNDARREAHLTDLTLSECVVLDDRPEFFADDAEVASRLLLTDPEVGLSSTAVRRALGAALDATWRAVADASDESAFSVQPGR